jgi:hypothetical protein
MSERGKTLTAAAEVQIEELTELIASREDSFLRMPCPGRENLGDGSVAACAMHAADNYRRIGSFALHAAGAHEGGASANGAGDRSTAASPRGGTRRPSHMAPQSQRIDRRHILETLRAARTAIVPIAELSDVQLDSVPPADEMRFCDGQRTLEQILTAMLRHQDHQVKAIGVASR